MAKVKINGHWGLIDKKGNLFLPPYYDLIYAAAREGRVVACIGGNKDGHGGLWGFTPRYFGDTLSLRYELIRESGAVNRLSVLKNRLWGAIDAQGQLIIPCIYEVERPEDHTLVPYAQRIYTASREKIAETPPYLKLQFLNGKARVRRDDKWGYINTFGNAIIPFAYEYLGEFSQGLVCAIIKEGKNFKMGFLDDAGEWKIPPVYDVVVGKYPYQNFREGKVAVLKDEKWGYLDLKGDVIIPFQFAQVHPFAEGRALVSQDESQLMARWQIIDEWGHIVATLPQAVEWLDYTFQQGFIRGRKNDQVFYVNREGQILETPPLKMGQIFLGEYAQVVVEQNGQTHWGLLNRAGQWVLPPVYDFEGRFYTAFGNRYFLTAQKGQWGVVEAKSQKIVLPFEYLALQWPLEIPTNHFARNKTLFPARAEKGWCYVNYKGKTVIPGPFAEAQPFQEGYARVRSLKTGRWGYINAKGQPFFKDAY
ncbi:MAG: WG repeat-containing protein [Microscillaceae bacterium]|nr:WG repeat-containing protein [Microscillaceae bacterium]